MATKFNVKQLLPIVYLGLGGGVLFGAYKLYQKFAGDPNAGKTVDSFSNQAKTLAAQGQKPSFTDAEYGAIADTIYEPMAHSQPFSFIDDPYQPVYDGLKKMQNDLDVSNLIAKFGLRERDYFGILPDGSAKNLPTFVTDLISADKIADINSNYTGKGITFQF